MECYDSTLGKNNLNQLHIQMLHRLYSKSSMGGWNSGVGIHDLTKTAYKIKPNLKVYFIDVS